MSKGILGEKKNKGSRFLHKSQNSVLNFFYLIKQNTQIDDDFANPWKSNIVYFKSKDFAQINQIMLNP